MMDMHFAILPLVITYGIIALIYITVKKIQLAWLTWKNKGVLTNFQEHGTLPLVAQGKQPAQVWSFVLHLALILIGLTLLPIPVLGALTLFGYIALLIITPVVIIVNARWIYSSQILRLEAGAFYAKTATRLLYVQHLVAWLVWLSYIVYGIWWLITYEDATRYGF